MDNDLLKFLHGYLDYLGCPVADKRGVGETVRIPARSRELKDLRRIFGGRVPLDRPDFGVELLKRAKIHGSTACFRLRLSDFFDLQRCLADRAGEYDIPSLGPISGVEISERPMLLQIYKATLFTDNRLDRLICILSDWDGNHSVLRPPAVEEFLVSGRWGWSLNGGEGGPFSAVSSKEWVCQAVSAGYATAVTVSKRSLWRRGRQSRALLAEESRQIESFYAELTDDAMEPLRNLHRRMAEASAKRVDARYHETLERCLRDMRRLKSQVTQEEGRYRGAREDIVEEKRERMKEAEERYRPRLDLDLVQAAGITADVPVLVLEESGLPSRALRIPFNPVLGTPISVTREGVLEFSGFKRNTKLRMCRHGHIFDMAAAHRCCCGDPVCPACAGDAEGHYCAYCGDPLCSGCGGKSGSYGEGPICDGCFREIVALNFFGIGD